MSNNLLIVGAGMYAVLASEIAADMGCFDAIDFVDDVAQETPTGQKVVGTTKDIRKLAEHYRNMIVAIGNPDVRLSLLETIKNETSCDLVSLVSPKAYVAPSARVMAGCIIEPMAVVHTACVISRGCIISAGAVINHGSVCSEGVHVDCNATVKGYCAVPAKIKICSGQVYAGENMN